MPPGVTSFASRSARTAASRRTCAPVRPAAAPGSASTGQRSMRPTRRASSAARWRGRSHPRGRLAMCFPLKTPPRMRPSRCRLLRVACCPALRGLPGTAGRRRGPARPSPRPGGRNRFAPARQKAPSPLRHRCDPLVPLGAPPGKSKGASLAKDLGQLAVRVGARVHGFVGRLAGVDVAGYRVVDGAHLRLVLRQRLRGQHHQPIGQ